MSCINRKSVYNGFFWKISLYQCAKSIWSPVENSIISKKYGVPSVAWCPSSSVCFVSLLILNEVKNQKKNLYVLLYNAFKNVGPAPKLGNSNRFFGRKFHSKNLKNNKIEVVGPKCLNALYESRIVLLDRVFC